MLLFFGVLYVMVYWQKYLYLLLIDTSNCGNFSGKMMTPRQSEPPGDAPDTNWGEAPSCTKWGRWGRWSSVRWYWGWHFATDIGIGIANYPNWCWESSNHYQLKLENCWILRSLAETWEITKWNLDTSGNSSSRMWGLQSLGALARRRPTGTRCLMWCAMCWSVAPLAGGLVNYRSGLI